MNLIQIPHFGQSTKVNTVVKILLSRLHGGYMWMDTKISIDPHLIWRIIRLSKQGTNLSHLLMAFIPYKKTSYFEA